jgi:hypothetical protein
MEVRYVEQKLEVTCFYCDCTDAGHGSEVNALFDGAEWEYRGLDKYSAIFAQCDSYYYRFYNVIGEEGGG